MKWKMTGPGLPMSIVLPKDTCSWCGNPKDEPKTTDNNPDPGPGTNASPAADAGAPPTPSNPEPSPPDAATMTPPANPHGRHRRVVDDAAPERTRRPRRPPSTPATAAVGQRGQRRRQRRSRRGYVGVGGCSLGGGESAGAPAVLLLGLGLTVLAGRRRRQEVLRRPDICVRVPSRAPGPRSRE